MLWAGYLGTAFFLIGFLFAGALMIFWCVRAVLRSRVLVESRRVGAGMVAGAAIPLVHYFFLPCLWYALTLDALETADRLPPQRRKPLSVMLSVVGIIYLMIMTDWASLSGSVSWPLELAAALLGGCGYFGVVLPFLVQTLRAALTGRL